MKKNLKMVILSRSARLYSTQRLIEAGEKRGHQMLVVDHTKCDLVIEQEKPQIFYRGTEINQIDAIIPRIGASVTYFGAAVIRQFEMMKSFSATSSEALTMSSDKKSRCLPSNTSAFSAVELAIKRTSPASDTPSNTNSCSSIIPNY